MKRIIYILTVVFLTVALLSGCGKQQAEPDIHALADKLLSDLKFDEQLVNVELGIARQVYEIDENDIEDAVVYMGTGATVDEFSIWKAKDADSQKRVNEMVLSRVDDQKESYANYRPQEIPKLESAVVLQKGRMIILCVSPDSENAKAIINSFIN